MTICLTVNGYRDGAVWIYKCKVIVNGNKVTEIGCCRFDFNINLWLNNKFVTQKSQLCYSSQLTIQNPTVNLSALCSSCTQIACCSSQLMITCLYAASSNQNASKQFVWCVHLPSANFALHSNRQTEIQRISVWRTDSNSSILITNQN